MSFSNTNIVTRAVDGLNCKSHGILFKTGHSITRKIFAFVVALFLSSIWPLYGQVYPEPFVLALEKAGFEQLALLQHSDGASYTVSYEHRGLRNPTDAFAIIKSLADAHGIAIHAISPLFMGKPLGLYFSRGGKIYHDELPEHKLGELKNKFKPNKYRLNLVLSPNFQSRFGYYEDPYQLKFNMILGTTLMLGRGFGVYSGLLFPLINNLDDQPNNIRLAPTYLSHFFTFLNHHHVLSNAGLFLNDRYGLDIQYRYSNPSQRFSFGVEFGYTGFYFLPPTGIYLEPIIDQMALVDMEYFFPKLQLTAKVQMGQFMFSDRGVRVDAIRQYGEIDLGFYATQTQNGSNAGFLIHLPLLPRKFLRTKALELRMTESFRWEYFFNNEGNIGRKYRSGPLLNDVLRQYKSPFINYQNNSRNQSND